MLDLRIIREQPDRVRQALKDRNVRFDLDALLRRDSELRKLSQEMDELRHRKNKASEEIGRVKRGGGKVEPLLAEQRKEAEREGTLGERVGALQAELERDLLLLANLPHTSVPVGPDAQSNRIVRAWGEPRRFSFKARTHLELGESLRLMDFPRAARVAGSHFALFTGVGARLVRSLINFMLDLHTQEHGYSEIWPPLLVNRATMTGTGQLPKFEEDMYRLKEDDLFLVPTAEVPVTNLHAGELLDEKQLPIRYAAYTPCFRREAGSYGKETRGLTRVHQFDKVEMVKIVAPASSYDELEKLTADAERVLQLLELPYRVSALATGDLGFASAKTYDLESFSHGTGTWLEVSSCSNFEEFQARRASIRYREKETQKVRFVHTLNGSGVALARTIIALLETHQNADGSVAVPKALRPYLGDRDRLTAP